MKRTTTMLAAAAFAAPLPAFAQLAPEWMTRVQAGTSLSAGLAAMTTSPAGVTYITGTGGPSWGEDVLTTAINPDGSILWSHAYNGVAGGADQGRGIALAPGGLLYVCGNEPGPGSFAMVLVLKYNAHTGALLHDVRYQTGPGISESAHAVAVDEAGGVYAGGSTTGDGGDAMVIKFDPNGQLVWKKVWDGPAWGPYSQDSVQMMAVAPDGQPVALIHGIMASGHADYVVIKYDADDGAVIWESTWGVSGSDSPRDMEFDAAGDVYVTGTGIDLINKFSTIKLSGVTGQLIWQRYDALNYHNAAAALALDGRGGVYITGSTDPDGNQSNFNNNFYTVKRDAASGGLIWSHTYGDNCIGCFDITGDVRVDSAGNTLILGESSSAPYASDMLLLVLDAATGVEVNRAAVPGDPLEMHSGYFLRSDAGENMYAGGELYHVNNGMETMTVTKFSSLVGGCYPDANGDGQLTVADFGSFQTRFVAADPYADCNSDGSLTVADFGCFQTAFVAGCP